MGMWNGRTAANTAPATAPAPAVVEWWSRPAPAAKPEPRRVAAMLAAIVAAVAAMLAAIGHAPAAIVAAVAAMLRPAAKPVAAPAWDWADVRIAAPAVRPSGRGYDAWRDSVDARLAELTDGFIIDDLCDMPTRDWFDAGMSPAVAATEAAIREFGATAAAQMVLTSVAAKPAKAKAKPAKAKAKPAKAKAKPAACKRCRIVGRIAVMFAAMALAATVASVATMAYARTHDAAGTVTVDCDAYSGPWAEPAPDAC